jgi:3-methyladenine DNA glycosylase/8-oxoguanine DNA glycosylase
VTTEVTRRLTPPERYRFTASVAPLLAPQHDPCGRLAHDEFWLAARTPEGPASLHLARAAGDLVATAHGPGARWLADRADAVAGLRDDLTGFPAVAARHPVVERLARTFAGLRMPATGLLFHRLMRAVLEQKVTGTEAFRAYRKICRHFGEPAPGNADLVLPPDPAALAATPYWVFHPLGVEQRRTQTVLRAALVADSLQRCADAAEATERLLTLPGVGPWTAAEVVRAVFGDPDAVSVGDYHIPNTVAWAWPGSRAAPTPACWSCSSRSGVTGAGSANSSGTAGSGRRVSARGCRSGHMRNSDRPFGERRPLTLGTLFPS